MKMKDTCFSKANTSTLQQIMSITHTSATSASRKAAGGCLSCLPGSLLSNLKSLEIKDYR